MAQNTTSPLSPLTSMLLSNLSSHPTLVPTIAHLTVPIVPLPLSKHYPPYYFPASASSSSTIHPDYRDPAFVPPNKEAGQEEERPVEAVRALVQAFEDGASDGVKDGKGKRKGDCNFLASVFANITMVSERGLSWVNADECRSLPRAASSSPLSQRSPPRPRRRRLPTTRSPCCRRLSCTPSSPRLSGVVVRLAPSRTALWTAHVTHGSWPRKVGCKLSLASCCS